MRVLLQRVKKASLTIDNELVAYINKGYLLLVGFKEGDKFDSLDKMAKKVINSRLFEDENGKTNLSLKDVNGEILSVSQFTLYASMKEGNRPSFVKAMAGNEAKTFYALFNEKLKEYLPSLKEGIFGADMKIDLINDGPFTILFDSGELFGE